MLWGVERLKNVAYIYPKLHMVKINCHDVVAHNVAVYKNISTTLNEVLTYSRNFAALRTFPIWEILPVYFVNYNLPLPCLVDYDSKISTAERNRNIEEYKITY
jgi:hypothetical protein